MADMIVTIRFYEELNYFLAEKYKKRRFETSFIKGTTVKALIEDLGIPHTEVDLILINGNSVSFSYKLKNGDRISVYPVFETFDISGLTKLREKPLRRIRFVADVHLGKLAAYLRILGFDTAYYNNFSDIEIVECSLRENRIILTRDRGILKRRAVTHGCYIRSHSPKIQLRESLNRFNLHKTAKPFSLCPRCNKVLIPVSKEKIMDQVPPLVFKTYGNFCRCPECHRVYWKGTHRENIIKLFKDIILFSNQ
ncbi:MAG: Mut7-C ubiquitin/RNAse domain-containing protein [Spirochaetes bacterium]|nr:Mut7-C ubiquitin/RNAse domain-containing protein [Spirochaetota bacterium]